MTSEPAEPPVMDEEKKPKHPIFGFLSTFEWIVCGSFVGLVLVLLGVWAFTLRDYSTMEDGVIALKMPWKIEGVTINEISSGWVKKDNGKFKYLPSLQMSMKVDESRVDEILVYFIDGGGSDVGDPMSFACANGKIGRQDSGSVTATCTKGIETELAMEEYLMDDKVKDPWKFRVSCRKKDGRVYFIGHGDIARVLEEK